MKKTILLGMLAICSLNMQAQFSGQGSGTEKDPYQVTNADELFEVRNDMSAYYKQMNDIDLTEWIQEESPNQGWTPIGNETTPFSGTFDGDNHIIKGLKINRETANNIGLFGVTTNFVLKNLILLGGNVRGGNFVGGLVGKSNGSTIENCMILGSIISGKTNIGSVIGAINGVNWRLSNNAVIGGLITGNDNVGGILGGSILQSEYPYSVNNDDYILYNYASTHIVSKYNAGGIACNLDVQHNYYSYGNMHVLCNVSASTIEANVIGGIFCKMTTHSANSSFIVNYNILYGGLLAVGGVYGIGKNDTSLGSDSYTFNSNFCISENIAVSGNGFAFKISNKPNGNNYSYNDFPLTINGKQTTVEDSSEQGIGYGLRTLKKESTYVGAGFDFSNTWTIKEGETFPYLKAQVDPVTITSFEAGNKATIKGTATEGTTVYVMIGDNMFESYILDGQWEVSLGRVNVGTEAKVYAMSRGRMPSIAAKATAANGSQTTPEGKSGDANGDSVVDTADVTAIINYILGKPGSSFNKANADVNGDGEILIDDAVQTVQLIMNAQ